MNILFVGPSTYSAGLRIKGMGRIGHDVSVINPAARLHSNPVSSKFQWYTGGFFAEAMVSAWIAEATPRKHFDLVWVDSGRYIGPKNVKLLKSYADHVLCMCSDDPFGKRDGNSWLQYLRAVPEYDLLVVVRPENVPEAYARGAKRVLRVYRAADEIAHAPREIPEDVRAKWASEVVFVGTAFPERGPFMAELVELGVPLSIWGYRWQQVPMWHKFRSAWRGPGTDNDDDYAAAILSAKICLGLLSKENRDLHTRRSLEIPALGGLFCAERTTEHLGMYEDRVEAVFWDDARECAEICKELLADDRRRREIAQRGHDRAVRNGHYTEPFITNIIDVCINGGKTAGEVDHRPVELK